MKIMKAGPQYDAPIPLSEMLASAAVGNEYPLIVIPDLTALTGFASQKGASGLNSVYVRAAYLINGSATLTGQATNNLTFQIVQRRAGALVNTNGNNGVLVSYTTASGSNLTQFVAALLDPGANAKGYPVQRGDVLSVKIVQNGTGQAVPAILTVQVDLEAYVDKQ